MLTGLRQVTLDPHSYGSLLYVEAEFERKNVLQTENNDLRATASWVGAGWQHRKSYLTSANFSFH